jgi:hypothetical protein
MGSIHTAQNATSTQMRSAYARCRPRFVGLHAVHVSFASVVHIGTSYAATGAYTLCLAPVEDLHPTSQMVPLSTLFDRRTSGQWSFESSVRVPLRMAPVWSGVGMRQPLYKSLHFRNCHKSWMAGTMDI